MTGVPAAQLFTVASTSGLAVGVPGTLAALDTALKRFGTIKLSEAIEPAIAVAEQGFRINRFLAANILGDGGRTTFQPETAALFRPGGVALKEGDLLVPPDLAKTLRLIAQRGADVFYKGEIARAIVAAQQRSRAPVAAEGAGRMTLQDLADYNVVTREPTNTTHFSVVDKWGNVVSYTTTIEATWGTGILVPGAGSMARGRDTPRVRPSRRIHRMHLDHSLRQVDADTCNLAHGLPLSASD